MTSHRIPSLDGLRAISIAIVLFAHSAGTRHFPINSPYGLADLPQMGPFVFFVISGFLITGLLLNERVKSGSTSLTRFYRRRFFRIFPAFYFYVAVIAILAASGAIRLHDGDLRASLTYTLNYHANPSWYVGHIWSLSTEEQFYLIWPLLFCMLNDRKLILVAVMGVLAPLLMVPVRHYYPPIPGMPDGLNLIAAGCLLALVRPTLQHCRLYKVWLLNVPVLPFVVIAGYIYTGYLSSRIDIRLHLLAGVALGPAIAVVMDSSILYAESWLGKCLNSRPMKFIGVMSYSLYLWQSLFLDRYSDGWWAAFPLNLLCALAAALGSYYLIERPFLRVREEIERRFVVSPPRLKCHP